MVTIVSTGLVLSTLWKSIRTLQDDVCTVDDVADV